MGKIDFPELYQREKLLAYTSDFIMHVALSRRGYTVYPWAESAQNFDKKVPQDEAGRAKWKADYPSYIPEAAFQHDHKEHYKDPVPEEERKILTRKSEFPRKKKAECIGCIWYLGMDPSQISKTPPPVADEADLYRSASATTLPAEC